jgi:hypothetical protein
MSRKKRQVRRRPETLGRYVTISSVSVGVSLSAGQQRGEAPHIHSSARITITGTMDEPLRSTRDVEIVLYPSDEPTLGAGPPQWIGVVHPVQPVMRPAVFTSHRDFDRVWALALSGMLKQARVVLTMPRYQSADVLSISFSSHPEE